MNEDALRAKAKAAGIKSWHVKRVDKLMVELAAIDGKVEAPPDPIIEKAKKEKLIFSVTKEELDTLELMGFKSEWLASLANQYNFTKIAYIHKFRAFRCYQGNNHVDWININDLSLLNGGRELTPILLKHQRLDDKRAVIKYKWR